MKSTIIRFPEGSEKIFGAMKNSAKRNRRSLNSELLNALDFYLKNAPEAQTEFKEVPKRTFPK